MEKYSADYYDVLTGLSFEKRRIIEEWVIRSSDLTLSILALIMLLPLFAFISMFIKLDSRGKAFFTQERAGKDGKVFKIYKFRSMYHDADKMPRKFRVNKDGTVEPVAKFRNDTRVTRVGDYIRKYCLDELPQLINVVKGEMSLVGPRPHPIYEVKLYSDYHKQRLAVRPGITGLAQVRDLSSNSIFSFDKLVEFDLDYIHNKSVKLYYKLIFQTIPYLFIDKGNF